MSKAKQHRLTPLYDKIVVRRVGDETMTAGGIYIPDTAQDKPQQGEVLAVGDGRWDETGKFRALRVKAGDMVLFGKYAGSEIKLDGEEVVIMREEEILGILRPENKNGEPK